MEIVERIKKLYALSERNSSTEEAAAAAAKIQELCFKYNLELEAILKESGEAKEPYIKSDYLLPNTTRVDVGWKRSLFFAVAEANFCKAIYYPKTVKMGVVGQKSNFEVACYEWDYLVREIQRLAVRTCVEQGYYSNKDRRKYIAAFCEGAASTVGARLRAAFRQQSQSASDCTALVVVKDKELADAVKVHYPRLRHVSRRIGSAGNPGYGDGRRAGQSIGIHRGIGSTSRTLLN